MATTELLLIRHGESEGNVAATTASRDGLEVVPVTARDADVPLSAAGVEQADALGTWLRGSGVDVWPDQVWSSPYLRAQQTAEYAFGLEENSVRASWRPLVDERLRDRELGILDALTGSGVEARFPGEAARRRWLGKFYYRPPGGESWADLALRVRFFLTELDRADSPRRVAVVCHDAVVLVFRYVCEGLTEDEVLGIGRSTPVVNTGLSLLARDAGSRRWQPRLFNSVAHLEQQNAPLTEHGGDRDVFAR
ncbi:histidine phosphatase family protein [Planctomonas psychrotolerans]|uniref:histidine phosphatase family protein n=1 Tax=Planctomonas psychrotolerans TaxID=2528712 RepID=UPI001239D7FA|nr:histidine phosphatase family protein [Planctomonas psychrotolerans]